MSRRRVGQFVEDLPPGPGPRLDHPDEEVRKADVRCLENQGLLRLKHAEFCKRIADPGLRADLFSVCQKALLRASRLYDESRGLKFSTYAAASMVREMCRSYCDLIGFGRLPAYMNLAINRYKREFERLKHERGRDPDFEDVVAGLGLTESQKRDMRCGLAVRRHGTCLPSEWRDWLEDDFMIDQAPDHGASDASSIEKHEALHALWFCLGRLSDRDRDLVISLYGLDGRKPVSRARMLTRSGLYKGEFGAWVDRVLLNLRAMMCEMNGDSCDDFPPVSCGIQPDKIPSHRVCKKCGVERPLNYENFAIARTCKCGFRGVCRRCGVQNAREYRRRKQQEKQHEQAAEV